MSKSSLQKQICTTNQFVLYNMICTNTVLFQIKFVYLLIIAMFFFYAKPYGPSWMHSWNIFYFGIEFGLSFLIKHMERAQVKILDLTMNYNYKSFSVLILKCPIRTWYLYNIIKVPWIRSSFRPNFDGVVYTKLRIWHFSARTESLW